MMKLMTVPVQRLQIFPRLVKDCKLIQAYLSFDQIWNISTNQALNYNKNIKKT